MTKSFKEKKKYVVTKTPFKDVTKHESFDRVVPELLNLRPNLFSDFVKCR